MKPFWMVYKQGGLTPAYHHESEQSARDEAARLAAKQPGDVFNVLACIATARCEVAPVKWDEVEAKDEREFPRFFENEGYLWIAASECDVKFVQGNNVVRKAQDSFKEIVARTEITRQQAEHLLDRHIDIDGDKVTLRERSEWPKFRHWPIGSRPVDVWIDAKTRCAVDSRDVQLLAETAVPLDCASNRTITHAEAEAIVGRRIIVEGDRVTLGEVVLGARSSESATIAVTPIPNTTGDGRRVAECPLCGGRMVVEFDEEGDHEDD